MANPTTETKQRTKKEVEETGPRTVDEFILTGGVDDVPTDRPESQDLANAIDTAATALEEKAEVLSRIQAAREYTTLSTQMGNGSRDQVAWVRFYLPRKKRRGANDEDEVEVED